MCAWKCATETVLYDYIMCATLIYEVTIESFQLYTAGANPLQNHSLPHKSICHSACISNVK